MGSEDRAVYADSVKRLVGAVDPRAWKKPGKKIKVNVRAEREGKPPDCIFGARATTLRFYSSVALSQRARALQEEEKDSHRQEGEYTNGSLRLTRSHVGC